MVKDCYFWWVNRMCCVFEFYDEFCIDYFRGFVGYWVVEVFFNMVMSGKWLVGLGEDFFVVI